MKLVIEENSSFSDTEIHITCPLMTPELEELVAVIRLHMFSVTAKKDGETHLIHLEDVYYFESVDGRTFVYTKDDVYETGMKLYEIDEELSRSRFMRASKSVILNLSRLKSVRSLGSGRMSGTLDNGEQVIITRKYVADLKRRIGLG